MCTNIEKICRVGIWHTYTQKVWKRNDVCSSYFQCYIITLPEKKLHKLNNQTVKEKNYEL